MMKTKTVVIIAIIFVLYLLLGAGVFHLIESPNEMLAKERAHNMWQDLQANLSLHLSEEQVMEFVEKLMDITSAGLNPMKNESRPTNWDFNSAFFFSGTVVTTIGYGNNAPQTQTGRNICIIYALIGIPLCGFLLTGIGEKLSILAKKLEGLFYDRVTCGHPTILRLTFISILLIIGGILFITIPSIIFMYVEGWKLHESWYYCFITLTTIGFGDFVIAQNPDQDYISVYPWICYIWIIIGMSFLALIISLLSDIMTDTAGKLREEQKQRLQQLKSLTGKQLTRLSSSSDKRFSHKSTAAHHPEHGNGEMVGLDEDLEENADLEENEDVQTPLDTADKVITSKEENAFTNIDTIDGGVTDVNADVAPEGV